MAKIKNQNLIIVGGKEPVLQEKSVEITENTTTTYTADEGFDGLKSLEVTTNVAGSGGGINPALIERTATEILPEDLPGITKLGTVFINYPTLTKIELPEGLTEIGASCFANAGEDNRTKLTLPSTLTKIDNYAFQNRVFDSDVTIPASVETIGISAFESTYSCGNFIGSTVTICAKKINSNAFRKHNDSPNKNSHVILGEGVEYVGSQAFTSNAASNYYYNTYGYYLEGQLPSTLTRIENSAFRHCGFLKTDMGVDTLIIPDSVTYLGQDAFSACGNATCNVVVGSSIKIIYGNVFKYFGYNYSSTNYPKTITFKGDITNIYAAAFQQTTFNKYDFSNCTSVPTLANTNAFSSIYGTWNIIVPDELYDTWVAATNWSSYASKIIKKSEAV